MKARSTLQMLRIVASSSLATCLAFAVLHSTASAQSLTLSFQFDQGTATSTTAPVTSMTITAANSGQTYLVDVFATVTGTSGNTTLSNLGINNINFRGYSSSTNNAAFSTGGSVGVQNDANLQSNSSANLASVPTSISDGGSTTNGTTTSATADGVIDLPGTSTIGGDNWIVTYTGSATKYVVGGQAASAYGTTGPSIATVNNPSLGAATNAFQTLDSSGNPIANSFTFLVGQFDYTIGTVSAAGASAKTTSFVPTVSSAQGSNVTGNYTVTTSGSVTSGDQKSGTATKTTGAAEYSIGSSVSWVLAGTGGGGNTSVLNLTPSTTTLNVLAGGSANATLALANTNAASSATYTGANTSPSSGSVALSTGATSGTVAASSSASPAPIITYNAPAASTAMLQGLTFTYTVTNTANASDVQGTNANKTTSFKVNFAGAATEDTSNTTTSNTTNTFGTADTASVTHNSTYAGLTSEVTSIPTGTSQSSAAFGPSTASGGDATGSVTIKTGLIGAGSTLRETASILAGVNSTASSGGTASVSMGWRSRVAGETTIGAAVPKPISTVGLVSDVVSLTGLTAAAESNTAINSTDPFVFQMAYNPNLLSKANHNVSTENALIGNSLLYLVSLTPAGANTNVWERASNENTGNVAAVSNGNPGTEFAGSFAQYVFNNSRSAGQAFFDTNNSATSAANVNLAAITASDLNAAMGAYGADSSTHLTWMIVNHNSQFAVVPEPTTIALAGLGLIGLVAMRRKSKAKGGK